LIPSQKLFKIQLEVEGNKRQKTLTNSQISKRKLKTTSNHLVAKMVG